MNGIRERSFGIHSDASAHDLMNDAKEVLEYTRGLAALLADLVHEAEFVDRARMVYALEAIETLTYVGVQCATQAHTRMVWELVPPEMVPAD